MSDLKSIILAAGEGTRMNSSLPKVLHKVLDKEMLRYVISVSKAVSATETIVVVGHKGDIIKETIKDEVIFVEQKEQLGTGHAVMMADKYIGDTGNIIILYGDTPLVTKETIDDLLKFHKDNENSLTIVSAILEDSRGYGRIVRKNGVLDRIVEHKDATESERDIKEINTGIYCFEAKQLKECLKSITNNNSQSEYYLTDAIEIIIKKGLKAGAMIANNITEFFGVNNRVQLEEATKIMRDRINTAHMINGVTFIDKNTAYVGKDVTIGKDTIIYPNVCLEGKTDIGENCVIGSNSRVFNSIIKDKVNIESSIILESSVGSFTNVGPFAYIRPNSKIGEHVKIGDFVEIKNAVIGNNTKASHLTYIGDADVGENINFGCGTVTVNYDGSKKFRTVIEDDAFIGCNSNLVAPVCIKKGSYVAAGSTITDEVPENTLAIARARQVIKINWTKNK